MNISEKTAVELLECEFDIVLRQNLPEYVDSDFLLALSDQIRSLDPPSNNMGGTPIPTLINLPQCEIKSGFDVKQETKIDWFSFTTPASVEVLEMLLGGVWPNALFLGNGRGTQGYPCSMSVMVDDVLFGTWSYGAAHGRNSMVLTGVACRTLTIEKLQYLYDGLSLDGMDVRVSRVDICLDLFRGERTFDHALRAYGLGFFRRPNSPSNPLLKRLGSTSGKGENLGRTMYIGKRGGHVMGRVYEKGLEVYSSLPDGLRALSELRSMAIEPVDGEDVRFVADSWLRLEVEYRRQGKDLLLPLDMLLYPDKYFAGAYPYFNDALGMSVDFGVRPPSLKSDFDVDLGALIQNGKRSYGPLIYSLIQLGASSDDVIAYLCGDSHNKKLVKSGMLGFLREHIESSGLLPLASVLDDEFGFDCPF